jgi:transcriptional regulator of aroF, aroG, tyrA and aromatic amino acid transport
MERAMILCESNSLISENIILDINHLNNIEVNENKSIKKLKDVVKDTETTQIKNALNKVKAIRTAAKSLGESHTTIINKINKYNIHRLFYRLKCMEIKSSSGSKCFHIC